MRKKTTSKETENKKTSTIKDIAKRAKVSIGTVDRVLHNRGRVDQNTAQKVRKIIKEINYKPNILASHLSRAKTYTFGVVIPNKKQDSGYWEASIKGIEEAAKELKHYNVNVKYFFYDRYAPEKFSKIHKQIITMQLDGLVIAPILHDQVSELIQKLKKPVPFVFINTELPDFSPLAFIGQDSFHSGLVCGKLMKMLITTKGTVAVIITIPNDSHIQQRTDGFQTAFQDDKLVSVKKYEIFQIDDAEKTTQALDEIFKENANLRGLFVANVATHYVAEYLSRRNTGTALPLIGYDLIEQNIRFLNEGVINFLISQKPEQQGYEGIYALYRRVILKETCPQKIFMPIDIITKENLRYYKINNSTPCY